MRVMEIMYTDLFSPRRLGCEGIVARVQIQQDVIIFYFFIHVFGSDKRLKEIASIRRMWKMLKKEIATVPKCMAPWESQQGSEYFDGNSPQFQYQENGKDRDRCWEVYRFILKWLPPCLKIISEIHSHGYIEYCI